jgi:hypothetical protein
MSELRIFNGHKLESTIETRQSWHVATNDIANRHRRPSIPELVKEVKHRLPGHIRLKSDSTFSFLFFLTYWKLLHVFTSCDTTAPLNRASGSLIKA